MGGGGGGSGVDSVAAKTINLYKLILLNSTESRGPGAQL